MLADPAALETVLPRPGDHCARSSHFPDRVLGGQAARHQATCRLTSM